MISSKRIGTIVKARRKLDQQLQTTLQQEVMKSRDKVTINRLVTQATVLVRDRVTSQALLAGRHMPTLKIKGYALSYPQIAYEVQGILRRKGFTVGEVSKREGYSRVDAKTGKEKFVDAEYSLSFSV